VKVCIIGGVAGGATAAARLRRLDETARIILFERGDYISFANCGLPYHISGRIKERSSLLLQTPERFWSRFRVEVRIGNEILAIDARQKLLKVKNRKTGEQYTESYDYLILSPGAYPFVPPIEGNDAAIFMNLYDIPGMDAMIARIENRHVKEAVVIGGGFIGVEIAENLIARGIKTHLVEMLDQVMMPFDPEMAAIIQARLAGGGICLHLSDGVKKIVGDAPGKVVLDSGTELGAGLVISAVGVRPETRLAREAGLKIGATGGIAVDAGMKTSDPFIFAVGDAVETTHLVGGMQVLAPLAGPANKQARIAADNLCGLGSRYPGSLGTSIVKVFDLQAAATGLNEKTARKNNLPYQAIHLHPLNHAGYYPGAAMMALKLLFEIPGGRILGAQCIGADGADKRIDVIATAIRAGMTVYDLEQLELSYAPPFGSAKDPVNMAGFTGGNILRGLVESVTYDQTEAMENSLFLDVRTDEEFRAGSIPQSIHIPLDELRERIHELPQDRHLIIACRTGVRSYAAYRILKQSGFKQLSNLSGGYLSYCHYTNRTPPAAGQNETGSGAGCRS
jgi:NADPH-dependent 2,4-dienoyl-CoA reductase/sulfur reductase-like enzyme/rhodanese-related sulfurtransferase